MARRRKSENSRWIQLLGRNSWAELEGELANAAGVLQEITFEPLPGPQNKRARRKSRNSNKYGALVPTTPTTNLEELAFWRDNALGMVVGLKVLIRNRKPSVELVLAWGAFQWSAAMVLSAVIAWKEDAGRKHSGEKGGAKISKIIQKKWVARELQRLRRSPNYSKRHLAESCLARSIKTEIKASDKTGTEKIKFLESLLTRDGDLRHSYIQSRFADSTIERLCKDDMYDVPSPLAST